MDRSSRRGPSPRRVVAAAVVATVALVAVGLGLGEVSSGADSAPTTVLTVWRHSGTSAENETFARQVAAFNREQAGRPDPIAVRVRTIAEGDYNDTVQAAGAARTLPDMVEVDGPNVASWAYQGMLRPLDGLMANDVLADQIPSLQAQDEWRGHRWALGVFDSGLGIYASRSALQQAGVRIPTRISDAWTATEFAQVLRALAAHDPDGKVLDVKRDYGVGEWLTYGFAPLVSSAGGTLLDPSTGAASGHLDGPAALAALHDVSLWAPSVDPDSDGSAFVDHRVALSWAGHWVYPDYATALGDDLVVLPLPDLGQGTKTGQGSWAWGVSADSPHAAAAKAFLTHLLTTRQVLAMTDADGAVPGTRGALARSTAYRADGPLHLFAEQLLASCGTRRPSDACVSVPRPMTPGYPTLTSGFASAVDTALSGGDYAAALHTAATLVDADRAASDDWR